MASLEGSDEERSVYSLESLQPPPQVFYDVVIETERLGIRLGQVANHGLPRVVDVQPAGRFPAGTIPPRIGSSLVAVNGRALSGGDGPLGVDSSPASSSTTYEDAVALIKSSGRPIVLRFCHAEEDPVAEVAVADS